MQAPNNMLSHMHNYPLFKHIKPLNTYFPLPPPAGAALGPPALAGRGHPPFRRERTRVPAVAHHTRHVAARQV